MMTTDIEAKGSSRQVIQRRGSALGIKGIADGARKLLANADPVVKELVEYELDHLDANGDGSVDSSEVVQFAINLCSKTIDKNEQLRQSRRLTWMMAAALTVVVALSAIVVGLNYSTSFTAAKNAQETAVEGANLVTKDHEVVHTGQLEVGVAIAALPFLSPAVVNKVKALTFTGPGGEQHHTEVKKIVIDPRKSVLLSTNGGDILRWDNAVDRGSFVNITLDDGTSWKRPAGCDECTAINVIQDESLTDGIDDFHAAISSIAQVEDGDGRRLENIGIKDGMWEKMADDTSVWRYRLRSEGCNSLNFAFVPYWMPPGGELWIYDAADKTKMICNPFTEEHNNNGELWTPIIASCDVLIEVDLPAGTEQDKLKLNIASVQVAYRRAPLGGH